MAFSAETGFSEGYITNSIYANLIFFLVLFWKRISTLFVFYIYTFLSFFFSMKRHHFESTHFFFSLAKLTPFAERIVENFSSLFCFFFLFLFSLAKSEPVPREDSRKFLVTILFLFFFFFIILGNWTVSDWTAENFSSLFCFCFFSSLYYTLSRAG